MGFGLTNAPAKFQRLMEAVMGDLHLMWCLIYLYDVVVFCRTFNEHQDRSESIFQHLSQAGMKPKQNVTFLKHGIKYLGHIVSEAGIETDPDKVEVLKS